MAITGTTMAATSIFGPGGIAVLGGPVKLDSLDMERRWEHVVNKPVVLGHIIIPPVVLSL